MIGPKQAADYPDRDIDCQEAVSQAVAELIEQASISGRASADAAAEIADTGVPGVREIIDAASEAGWSREETENAIKEVAAGMYRGFTGTERDE